MRIIFLVAVLLMLYTLVGYPVFLALLRRMASRPVAKANEEPYVTAIIPVYNGERYLADKLRSLRALDYPREKLEILVVSDGSMDGTSAIASRIEGVQLIELPRGGKCAALNAAIPLAKGEILLLTDARQIVEPSSLRRLVANFADPSVGAVSGHLKIGAGETMDEADTGLYWRFESWMRDSLSAIDSMFGATGPFYAMRRNLAVPIPPDILLDDMYLPLSAFRRNFRLVVEPQAVAWDYPTGRDIEFQRKVRTMAGNYQLWMHYPWLLTPANRMWLHFLSYKVARLLLPELLTVIALSSFFLPDTVRILVLAMQAGFYGMALANPWLPRGFPLKRLTSLAHTFVTMMWAAVAGLKVFFVPARDLWKVTGATSAEHPMR